jgi:hypothetical protein
MPLDRGSPVTKVKKRPTAPKNETNQKEEADSNLKKLGFLFGLFKRRG